MESIRTLLILIPALPLVAVLVTAVLGPRVLRGGSHWPTILAIGGAFLVSLALLFQVHTQAEYQQRISEDVVREHEVVGAAYKHVGYEQVYTLWNWATVDSAYEKDGETYDFSIDVALRADALTAMMLSMVTFISLLVAIYSRGYMHDDPGYWRFYTYISLFVFSMTMLVSVSNFLLLYVFWEAVGACSYLLIGFWYQKPEAVAAGKKAFLVNRVGDFGFVLGLFLIWTTYGSLNYHDVVAADGVVQSVGVLGQTRLADSTLYVGGGVGLAICLLLLAGACGKSAQFPLQVWLPDAMEGPTPVSALIHAATMVTAGIYMIVRCAPLFFASLYNGYLLGPFEIPEFLIERAGGLREFTILLNGFHVVAIIGGITALIAGIIAVTQNDLKRVLAYSTVSQLGFMFLALGVGSLAGMVAAMFHLFTHAFFKALLFLGAGSVMHSMGGVIDMRRFGGLRRIMPITHWTFLAGCLALSGIFPLAGFWSKDAILAAIYDAAHSEQGNLVDYVLYSALYYVASFAAFLTAFYMFRAFYLTFYGEEEVPPEAHGHAHESPGSMTVPLVILAICSVGVGYLFHAGHTFEHLIDSTPSLAFISTHEAVSHAEFHWDIAIQSSVLALAGVALASFFYLGDLTPIRWLARNLRTVYRLSYHKMYFDEIYAFLIVRPTAALAKCCYWIDRNVIDALVDATGRLVLRVGSMFRGLQSGLVQFYGLVMLLGLLVLFITLPDVVETFAEWQENVNKWFTGDTTAFRDK